MCTAEACQSMTKNHTNYNKKGTIKKIATGADSKDKLCVIKKLENFQKVQIKLRGL